MTGWTINWGDGTSSTLNGNVTGAMHVFETSPAGQATNYAITAAGIDANGSHAANSLNVAVSPAAPVFTLSGDSAVTAGDDYTLDLVRVSGGQALTWTINWGDGNSTTLLGSETEADHTYAEHTATTYTVSATVTTSQATVSAGSFPLSMTPIDPSGTIDGDTDVDDGTPYTLTLAASPPIGDTIQNWTINWGDGTAAQTVDGATTSVTHTFPIGVNTYAITATVADLFGSDWDAGEVVVDVDDVGPTATADQQPPVTVNEDAIDQAVLDVTTLFKISNIHSINWRTQLSITPILAYWPRQRSTAAINLSSRGFPICTA